ncbi:MAG TPA: hypothetical protein VLT59_01920 [Steroidobacteraceae bacterium]|nr:hypothetical protein [Steroidobacteraceae bacterium]
MTTEWLKIMLDEIARKEQEAREAHEEDARRRAEQPGGQPVPPAQPERGSDRR